MFQKIKNRKYLKYKNQESKSISFKDKKLKFQIV